MDPQQEAAFRTFVATRSRPLLHTAWLLTGDPAAAQDLLQEALARLVPQWRRVDDPSAYVRATMHRLQINRWRRNRLIREEPTAAAPEQVAADRLGSVDDRLVLVDALRRLSDRQRSVLICRYIEDLDERAAAERLGISVGAVRSIGHRALARLRKLAPELGPTAAPNQPDTEVLR